MADMLTQETGQGDAAVERLPTQFRGKPRMEALLRGLVSGAETLETGLLSLYSGRMLATCSGAMLDVYGRIVGEERRGLADAPFRLRIRAAIATNRSSGTGNELLRIFGLMTPFPAAVREEFPAALAMSVGGGLLLYPEVYLDVLRRAKAGGVRAVLEWLEAEPESTFTLDDEGYGRGLYDEEGFAILDAREDDFDPAGTSAAGFTLTAAGAVTGVVTGAVCVRITAPNAWDAGYFDYSLDDGATWLPGGDGVDTLPHRLSTVSGNLPAPSDPDDTGLVLDHAGSSGFYAGVEVYRWPITVVAPESGGILASCALARR